MSKKLTKENFIQKAKNIHNNKYDYSKVEYINNHTKVCIICPEHGEFWQTPGSHLSGCGCKKCYNKIQSKSKLSSLNKFIEKAKKVHGDKYNYSKVEYIDSQTKVCIICPEHGEFWQTPNNHLRGQGCIKCFNNKRGNSQKSSTDKFIEKSIAIHGDTYDYSKVQYINISTKVCIICKIHGEFLIRPDHHLTSKSGCPQCKESHLETEISNLLKKHNIKFERQKTFKWLFNDLTLCYQYIDFYLPDYNIAIECQGKQHFQPVKKFGGETQFKKQLELDERKKILCEKNNLDLIYFTKEKVENEKYFKNKNALLLYIKTKKESQ